MAEAPTTLAQTSDSTKASRSAGQAPRNPTPRHHHHCLAACPMGNQGQAPTPRVAAIFSHLQRATDQGRSHDLVVALWPAM